MLLILLLAAFPSVFLTQDPAASDLSRRLQPPAWQSGDWEYPLGADALGRDLWSRIVVSARITVTISILAVVVSSTFGVALGMFSGYFRGKSDAVIGAVTEIQLAVPSILLALTIIAVRGPDTTTLVLIMSLTGWVLFARVIRSRTLSLREAEFIDAARVIGCSTPRILWWHILPQLTAPIAVTVTLEMARMILLESALSFLGLGVQAPDISWGQMISDGRQYLTNGWWLTALPGLAIALTVLAVNSVGDWLGDVLDPAGHAGQ